MRLVDAFLLIATERLPVAFMTSSTRRLDGFSLLSRLRSE
jgi:hypothetical protein